MKTLLSIWEMIPNITKALVPLASLGVVSVLLQNYLKRKAELRELEMQWIELMKEYHAQYFRGNAPAVSGKLDSCYTKIRILEKNRKILNTINSVWNCFPDQDSEEFYELQLEINHDVNFSHNEFWEKIDEICKLIKR
ncbi:MAG: hypothetical protein EHM20_02595 [Alphaproteobacteria bacterium]|nr:MAG: hypothetical protein EHM20_02595 [Alphaproteobacteria bacterium]